MTPRHPINWHIWLWLVLATIAPVAVWLLDLNPRAVGAVLGVIAAFAICYRLVQFFTCTPVLARGLAIVLLLLLLMGSIGAAQSFELPFTTVTYPLITVRIFAIMLAWYWPWWTDTTHSPLRRAL
jgi:hypothetical protein